MTKAQYYVLAKDAGNNVSSQSNSVDFRIDCNLAPPGMDRSAPDNNAVIADVLKPDKFMLESNFPNPFNPTTEIRYALAEDTHVSLKVYDMLGREVATLADEFQSAGYKTVRFDGSNLPSGIYLCRIVAGKFVDMKKMMLAK